jgi:uncharacterized protein DUF6308
MTLDETQEIFEGDVGVSDGVEARLCARHSEPARGHTDGTILTLPSHDSSHGPPSWALPYDDRVTANLLPPVVLRNGVEIGDPFGVVLGLLKAWRLDFGAPSRPGPFGEPDLRFANRGGARISAAQIAAILERRGVIEDALGVIAPDVSLAGPAECVPWVALGELFGAFAGIGGVGFSKMTKALHPKRPALIPMLDSIVQRYLVDDDLGARAAFGERAIGLVRGYQRDLVRNQVAVRAVQEELAGHGYELTEVRILDLLILSAAAAA